MPAADESLAQRVLAIVCSKWVRVSGDSMAPTLRHGRWVRVDRRAYRNVDPRRGDVVLFEHPRRRGMLAVKRVAGVPGDRYAPTAIRSDRSSTDDLVAAAGRLGISGVDDGASASVAGESSGAGRETLGTDEYFVLGDNQTYSTDSRSFGPIARRHIIGRVVGVSDLPTRR